MRHHGSHRRGRGHLALWCAARGGHPGAGQGTAQLKTIGFDTFAAVDIRVGTVVAAEDFLEARKPALKLVIDFGPEIGRRKSSAQITALYAPAELVGRQVLAVVNFAPRQIGTFMSEGLTLGVNDAEGRIALIAPDQPVPDGAKLH